MFKLALWIKMQVKFNIEMFILFFKIFLLDLLLVN